LELEDLRRLRAEFNSHAKSMREIHDQIRQNTSGEILVQKRFFFYSCVVEMPMSGEYLEANEIDPSLLNFDVVKNKIDTAITDETPFYLDEYSTICSEIAGP
jgi:hypothetical protein